MYSLIGLDPLGSLSHLHCLMPWVCVGIVHTGPLVFASLMQYAVSVIAKTVCVAICWSMLFTHGAALASFSHSYDRLCFSIFIRMKSLMRCAACVPCVAWKWIIAHDPHFLVNSTDRSACSVCSCLRAICPAFVLLAVAHPPTAPIRSWEDVLTLPDFAKCP